MFVPGSGLKTALRYERKERYNKMLECAELMEQNQKLKEDNQRLREIVAAQAAAIKLLMEET
jgi:hypothetical protein